MSFTLAPSSVEWLKARRWELGPEYDGCWSYIDLSMISGLSEEEAWEHVMELLERMQVEEVLTVPPGHVRFFRFVDRKPS